MYELALFAGSGGGILGGHLCGFTCIGAVEIEEYPREVLKQRQRDGVLPEFPIWDDVTTFRIDNLECREYIELLREHRENLIITGGFPCQDISAAGKGAGIAKDTRSGLWFEFARIIDEIRPARVLVENSPVLTSRGLGIVLGDLAEMGYNARWGVLGAVDVGAPHKRERIWIMANSNKKRCFSRTNESKKEFKEIGRSKPCFGRNSLADANSSGCERKNLSQSKERNKKTKLIRSGAVSNATGERLQEKRPKQQTARTTRDGSFRSMADTEEIGQQGVGQEHREFWTTEPELGRVANGVARRVDRLKAIGNGQVPLCAATAWQILSKDI